MLLGILPWSLILLAYARRLLSRPETRVLLVAGLGGLLFFSLAGSKRPVYLVPIYPPLALAIARLATTQSTWRRAFAPVAAVVGLVLLGGTLYWLPAYSEFHSSRTLVRMLPADVPIVCWGCDGDAVGFYLERDDVRIISPDRKTDLVVYCASQERTVLLVGNRESSILDILSPQFRVEAIGRDGLVTAALIRPGR